MLSNWFKKNARRQKQAATRTPRRSFRPGLELLEDRLVPAPMTFTVTDNTDNAADPGSIRAAVNSANLNPGSTITFAPSLIGGQTITLTTAAPLPITQNMTIALPAGASPVTINGNSVTTDFTVAAGVTASISGLTISGGRDLFPNTQSGGIQNLGTLTVTNDTFSNNQTNIPALGGQGAGAAIGNNAGATLTVIGCTFTGGTTPPVSGAGESGGIDNQGTLTVQNSTFSGNSGHFAGAISNRGAGQMTLTGDTFSGNSASNSPLPAGAVDNLSTTASAITNCTFTGNSSSDGAAVINDAGASLNITGSIFSGNTGSGSVIVNGDTSGPGTLTLSDSVVTGNTTTNSPIASISTININTCYISKNTVSDAFGGGGVALNASFGTFTDTIINTTIANNTNTGSLAGAGGIQSGDDTLTLIMSNVTIAGNYSAGGGAGGFEAFSGKALLTNVTITGNKSAGNAGGLTQFTSAVRMTNTLIAGNTNSGSNGDVNGDTPNAANGTNQALNCLIGNATGFTGKFTATNCIVGQAPVVSALGSFGGPILPNGKALPTVALLPGSPALNAGTFSNNNGVAVPATDERGFGRVGAPDIGAFESQGFTIIIVSGNNQVGLRNKPFQPLVVQVVANNPLEPVAGGQVTFTAPATGASVTFSTGTNTITVTIGSNNQASSGVPTANGTPGAIPVVASIGNGISVTFHLFIQLPIFATGAGEGGGPEVKVFDAETGAVIADFDAFAPSFTGGVRVAVADINGDGFPDIIAAAGPGGGPQVSVFDGRTFKLIKTFYAFAPGFTGGIFVAAGDVNNDGVPDIVCGAGETGGPQVVVFSGTNYSLLASFYAFAPNFTGGVRVAVGDVNGDGFGDIVCGAGPGGGPQVTVYSGKDLSILKSFFALPVLFNGGVYVAAGDLNGDGRADIIVGAGQGGLPQVATFDGATTNLLQSFFAYPPQIPKIDAPSEATGVRVGFDPLIGTSTNVILTGRGFGAPPEFKAIQPGSLKTLDDFFAYNELFLGGIFVAGA